MKHTAQFYDADFVLEGAVIDALASNEVAVCAGFAPSPRSHERASRLIRAAVAKSRDMGLTEDEIVDILRLNLSTYSIDPDTCPITEWLE